MGRSLSKNLSGFTLLFALMFILVVVPILALQQERPSGTSGTTDGRERQSGTGVTGTTGSTSGTAAGQEGQSGSERGQSASSGRTTQQSRTKGAGAALSGADRQFVMDAARDGMSEVELGRLASERASSDDVKKFAHQMIDDHSKAGDELMQLASQKGITAPKDVGAKEKALRDRLSKLSGADFDRQYMREMVDDHNKAVAKFQREASNGKDPDLKAWASKTLPTLRHHLEMARETSRKVMGSSTSEKQPPKSSSRP